MRLHYILVMLAISGCATPEQKAAQAQAEAEAQRQRDYAYSLGLERQCDAIGYQRDTDPWRACIMQLHGQAQAQNAQMRAIILQQYLQGQQRPAPTQTTCTRDFVGKVTCNTR